MYPYPALEDGFKFNTPHKVSDFHFRQLLYRRDHEENFSIVHPEIQGMELRNVMRYYTSPTTPKLHVKNPVPVAFELLNKFGEYNAGIDQFQMHHPVLETMYSVKLLQRLNTFPRDTTLTVNNPHEITFGGTVKPVLARPRLTGLTNQNNIKNAAISWEDASVTHGGYYLYRSKSPIPIDLNIEPYQILDRTSRSFVDYYIDDMETYYYRITPISVYGEYFSNLLKLDVPIFMGAPHSFIVEYDSHIPTYEDEFELFDVKPTVNQSAVYINRYFTRNHKMYYTGELSTSIPTYLLDLSSQLRMFKGEASNLDGHLYKSKSGYVNVFPSTPAGSFEDYGSIYRMGASASIGFQLGTVSYLTSLLSRASLHSSVVDTQDKPRNAMLASRAASNVVSFSSFEPPQGRRNLYTAYQWGNYVIPFYKLDYEIPGDDVNFTVRVRAFVDSTLDSGYEVGTGTEINITKLAEED